MNQESKYESTKGYLQSILITASHGLITQNDVASKIKSLISNDFTVFNLNRALNDLGISDTDALALVKSVCE